MEEQQKPGIKTTEFWLTAPAVAGALAAGAYEVLKDRSEPWARAIVIVAAIVTASLAAAGYASGRAMLKKK